MTNTGHGASYCFFHFHRFKRRRLSDAHWHPPLFLGYLQAFRFGGCGALLAVWRWASIVARDVLCGGPRHFTRATREIREKEQT